jgi:Response regulator
MTPVVSVIDDDPGVRRALVRMLVAHGLQAVAFGSAEEFLERFDPAASGCILVDLEMPGLSGLGLQHALQERGATTPLVFLTGHASIPSCVTAMRGGAVEYLTKPVEADALLAAVSLALCCDAALHEVIDERRVIEDRFATLTARERQVLPYVLAGKPSKQIASDLSIVVKTVKVHRYRIMHKVQARSAAELVWLAGRIGMGAATAGSALGRGPIDHAPNPRLGSSHGDTTSAGRNRGRRTGSASGVAAAAPDRRI